MSTKPATCLYDGTTIHEDSEESVALAYLAALGKPAAEVTVDGKSTRYYSSGDIFRAMLSLEGGCHEPPALLLGAHHAPELFLARITPDDMKLFKKGGREMWYSLSNDDGDLGNVCQEGIFALESLFEARVQNSYNACYRVIEYAELSCGDAVHAHGTTSRGRLPDGSYVLVAKVCDRMA